MSNLSVCTAPGIGLTLIGCILSDQPCKGTVLKSFSIDSEFMMGIVITRSQDRSPPVSFLCVIMQRRCLPLS